MPDATVRIERIRVHLRGERLEAGLLANGLGPALAARLAGPLAAAGPGAATVARLRATTERAAPTPARGAPAVADAIAGAIVPHLPASGRAR
jgi:hypothetical protein